MPRCIKLVGFEIDFVLDNIGNRGEGLSSIISSRADVLTVRERGNLK